jgi:hypothetical protein
LNLRFRDTLSFWPRLVAERGLILAEFPAIRQMPVHEPDDREQNDVTGDAL